MPAERYFIDLPSLEPHAQVSLEDQEFHHLTRVMRATEGENVELVNGRGQLARAKIVHLEKRRALLQISTVHTSPTPQNELILAQAIPRLNRLDFILEKGTELGATAFWLFPGQRSEREEFSDQQHHRLKQIIISAMKQCGRLFLPEIQLKPPLSAWSPLSGTLLFGDTRPEAPSLKDLSLKTPLIFFIGPEGGFDPAEVNILTQTLHARGVKLHENILRTDTAALVALVLCKQKI